MKNALLLSGSSYKDSGYLVHCRDWVGEFFSQLPKGEKIVFIPYAGVTRTNEEYEKKVNNCFEGLNLNIVSIHHAKDLVEEIKNANAIIVGGGNTFKLVYEMYKNNLFDVMKQRIEDGALYFGWSAGANLAGKTMMTTNDMPIIFPKSFDTLGMIPYNINPHFISGKIPGHNGESREQRLAEFMIVNPNEKILALPEGTGLRIRANEMEIIGHAPILQMQFNKDVIEIPVGKTIKF